MVSYNAVCCKHKYPELSEDSNRTEFMLADVRSYSLGFTCVLRRLRAKIVASDKRQHSFCHENLTYFSVVYFCDNYNLGQNKMEQKCPLSPKSRMKVREGQNAPFSHH